MDITVTKSISPVSSTPSTTTTIIINPESRSSSCCSTFFVHIKQYTKKWSGAHKTRPPRPSFMEIGYSWLGGFCGILALALVHYLHTIHLASIMKSMIVGSFGASAVLIYGVPHGPLSQPRNLVGGHVISALTGVIIRDLLVKLPVWTNGLILAAALSVSLSITFMQLTSTLHPPGAATALIAVIGDTTVVELGYMYILQPILSGSLIMLFFALLINNLSKDRTYPQYWW